MSVVFDSSRIRQHGKRNNMSEMKPILLEAIQKHAEGQIAVHKANLEVYMRSTTGIGEHPDIVEAMEDELKKIAEYDDILSMLDKYFPIK